jgi:hypothetical protein
VAASVDPMCTLIGAAKLNGVELPTYLRPLLYRILTTRPTALTDCSPE